MSGTAIKSQIVSQ